MSALRSAAFMFVISLVFTALVSGVKLAHDARIERNRSIKLQRIILKVLDVRIAPGTKDEGILKLFARRVRKMDVNGRTVYIGYQDDGRTVLGYAFPVGGAGFWGPVQGMAAVDPGAGKLIGLAFYLHAETPGLGGRIVEPWFQDQFKGLPLRPVGGGRKFFHLKALAADRSKGELDAITGATMTSRAVEAFLNLDLDRFLQQTFKSLKKD